MQVFLRWMIPAMAPAVRERNKRIAALAGR